MTGAFEAPTPPQRDAWPLIQRGGHVLVAAPTGSGKTLCAFLSAIDKLVVEAQSGPLPEETRVLYVSPLKALSNDIERNLQVPLEGVRASLTTLGYEDAPITTAVRTGDTTANDRSKHTRRPPHIYVTTPESLFILLTSDGGRRMLGAVETVIVDEVHALIRDKRGSHLALSLERLDDLLEKNGRKPAARIGLSATQKPISRVAEFLVGYVEGSGEPTSRLRPCSIVDHGHRRQLDLSLGLPDAPLESVMSAECWESVYDQLSALVETHNTVLVFTNTRKLAERITRFLAERIGQDKVTSHHGSLSRARRHAAERALKEGRLKALVATASLELGIDVGDVDLVCQIGSPGSIATFLQRVGRSGHFVGGIPKGRIFPTSRDDLVECVALLQAARLGELDEVCAPEAPLDILAQQLVAWVAPQELPEERLFEMARRAAPYRSLSRERFDAVVKMLAEGFATSRGRRGAYLHHDQVGKRIKARRGARLAAITNGGAIPDNFDYEVVLEPAEIKIGTVHEDFAIESMQGDIFQLGNTSYQILKVDPGVVRVADARGQPPTIPFWIGEAPSRSDELSSAVSRLRQQIADHATEPIDSQERALEGEIGIPRAASRQVIEYLRATLASLGHMPTQSTLVIERFFDETGGMHVVIHSPYGSRFNRAFGLSLRKRFCRAFNVELQAAAGEDALVLSLGPMHSFPLESVFRFLSSKTVREVLVQALLDAPLFQTRFRWNASRSLGVLRFRSGRKVPPRFQRMQSDDLLALCFPDQVACLENIPGDRNVPDHPLVEQTIHDSLTEAMDVDRLEAVLRSIEAGEIQCIARDVTEPSPLAHEILSARPYAFLDDAPLEERRTQAVQMRRFADPTSASDIGALNPEAIAQVMDDARPQPRDADELHDALLVHACLNEDEIEEHGHLVQQLLDAGRAFWVPSGTQRLLFATERNAVARGLFGERPNFPSLGMDELEMDRSSALLELVRGRLEMVGPATNAELAQSLGLPMSEIDQALLGLEGEGFAIRGRFRPGQGEEFCERRLLSRIHRLTLSQLRREIEPVSPAVFIDFLTHFQSLQPETRKEGALGTLAVIEQLSGFSCAAGAWESHVLPSRVRLYQGAHLDQLCLAGQVTWSAKRRAAESKASALTKASALRLLPRSDRDLWFETPASADEVLAGLHPDSKRVAQLLERSGALFFTDIRKKSGLLESQAERAVMELMGSGLITTDSFAGVRGVIHKDQKKSGALPASRRRRGRPLGHPLERAGRISWLPREDEVIADSNDSWHDEDDDDLHAIAWQLLARWGVVFRKVLEREPWLPSWASLLRVYHRLEARGEIRGGRFVSRFSGEQFATPEAISELRKVRKGAPSAALIRICGSDPLNLVGILTPGDRVPAVVRNQILIRGGIPLAVSEGGTVRLLPEATSPEGSTSGDNCPGISQSEAEQAFRIRPHLHDLEQLTAE